MSCEDYRLKKKLFSDEQIRDPEQGPRRCKAYENITTDICRFQLFSVASYSGNYIHRER